MQNQLFLLAIFVTIPVARLLLYVTSERSARNNSDRVE